ncbi:MAG: DUF192 domain-containing protein [Bacteroidales bacterium]|nr:DUF192 domain-containing protein [Bacteroidales bacterium]
MGKKEIEPNGGLLFTYSGDTHPLNVSIHMFFMRFDITVLWVNSKRIIVDKKFAKQWKVYFPSSHARYILEIHKSQFNNFEIGDHIQINE